MGNTGTRRRWLLACALALCGLGSLGAGTAAAAPGYRLSFGSTAQTTPSGGTLTLKGHRGSTSEAMVADQVIENLDGTTTTTRPGIGQLIYEEYPGSVSHRHWHYKSFVRYQLRSVTDLSLVRPDNKAGFCLSDPILALDFCGSQKPGALSVDEGLSPGVSDYYNPLLEGQYIDVADVPPGDYWLVHWVNSAKEICESNYANNAAAVKIALWPNGYGRAPYLTTKEFKEPFAPVIPDTTLPANCDPATMKLPDLVQKQPAEISVSVVGATGQAPGTGAPAAPALSRKGAKRYVIKALTRRFGKRPKRLRQKCQRTSPTSFVCRVRWRNRRYKYRGTVRILTIPTQTGFGRRVNLRVKRTTINCVPGTRCSKTITAKNMRFKKSGASTAARVSGATPLDTRVHVGSAGFPAAFPAALNDYGAPLGQRGVRAAADAGRAGSSAIPADRRLVDLPLLCRPQRVRAS